MNDPDEDRQKDEALKGEARSWLRRLMSGAATEADIAALKKWRSESPLHAKAFAEMALLWNVLGDATAAAIAANPALVRSEAVGVPARFSRRALIGGGAALAASFSAWAIVRPPFGLWPSFSELEADYRTRTGESRRIEVARTVAVEMNTQTSIDLRSSLGQSDSIELLTGEVTIAKQADPARPFAVLAGNGRVETRAGSFDIRRDGGSVCVTCLGGEVFVQHPSGKASLRERQQVAYDGRGFGQVVGIDVDIVTAWQRGLLIFRDVPLARVIDEVNRYRPGKIILIDVQLGRRKVVADFRLDNLDDVVEFVTRVMNVPARSLPGRIVLLG